MGRSLRVLIVDDDQVVRAQLADLLLNASHIPHELPSAIGVTRAIVENHVEVVVIDIMMPTMSGDKLASLLRKNPKLSTLAVILISSRPAAELQELAFEAGADKVVHKAQLATSFIASVEEAADRRQRVAGGS